MPLVENKKKDLEELINKAIKKVQGSKENDLCRYLPGPLGGCIHHFTLRKLKSSDPAQLFSLLQKFIIEKDPPFKLDPRPRAPRGSRKRNDSIRLSKADIEKVLELAKKAGDQDLLARFGSKRPLPSLKREFIRSIRDNQVNQDLWNIYCAAIASKV